MRLPARRNDDADVIRARLRALLSEAGRPGWVPDDEQDRALGDTALGDAAPEDEAPADEQGPGRGASVGAAAGSVPPGGRHRSPGPSVRVDAGRAGARALWAAAVGAVALLLVWTWLQRPTVEPVPGGAAEPPVASPGSDPSPAAATSPPDGDVAEASAPVVVSVVGLVAEPGLVTLGTGSRVADAIRAAGGLLPEADPASVNQAAPVADGQQIAVGVAPAPGATAATGTAPAGGAPVPGGGAVVNLNSADVAQLDGLPGIGPVLAQRIVDHRTQNGPFAQVDDLQDVPGIGPAILGQLADAVTV